MVNVFFMGFSKQKKAPLILTGLFMVFFLIALTGPVINNVVMVVVLIDKVHACMVMIIKKAVNIFLRQTLISRLFSADSGAVSALPHVQILKESTTLMTSCHEFEFLTGHRLVAVLIFDF